MPWLEWNERNKALTEAAKAPYRLMIPNKSMSYGEESENMLIEGDNLEALKALLPYYAGRVKCVFIDPPYNTKSAFEHYDDNLEHSQWLSMMYPRLVMLWELLSEDGSIWVTLDDSEAHYLKVMLDEVFGRSRFVATVIWEKADSPRNSARQFSSDHDYMLVYAKDPMWKPNKLPRTDAANSIYSNPDGDPRGPWLPGDPYANKPYSKGLYTIQGPSGRSFSPPPGRFWRISEEKLRELDEDGRIWWGPKGEARPSIKRYLNEVGDLVPRTFWRKEDVGSNRTSKNEMRALFPGESSFDTPKPEALIQRVLTIATEAGDIVLDSFLGSGTTSAVAHKMGRQWIGIEMGNQARTLCRERLVKVVDGERGGISKDVGWEGGGGFLFYTLGPKVFEENGSINPAVKFEHLAAHIWFVETGTPKKTTEMKSPLLGVHQGTAYYLLFNGILGDESESGGNLLTLDTLDKLPEHDGPMVIYAAGTIISKSRRDQLGISFKKTPYDIQA
ncbi:MAG: site-specific DNA-methyltransferase [Lysobacterales bacterium 14-68-21]|nr:MAG: site-specific DNA-methyltransferase [Xanthomonadales bacterium 15-68-25]OZB65375.1 MAG: site-specific DNA-methyltransferase [Xanthomonadales bacterium 14-68-21]